ncbi:hypothetical protein JMJ77_0011697, partial [Colletotrichum scovillei]
MGQLTHDGFLPKYLILACSNRCLQARYRTSAETQRAD